jgi:hypothetical protein
MIERRTLRPFALSSPSSLPPSGGISKELSEFNRRVNIALKSHSLVKVAEVNGPKPTHLSKRPALSPQWPDSEQVIPFMAREIDFRIPRRARIPEMTLDGAPLRFLQVSITLTHAFLLYSSSKRDIPGHQIRLW